ncbi:uncharacterized protein A4U43_C09F13680 [Asparagus officinalis]|uniref:Uncharacterized protein n=1 Tax=Asparagus officinalis TaxID=4686 RepID=A0A5P1E7R5_ASPOF|nr:uncharacterized protein A4U43_C09F13680 [Asparagus officinalis]
MWIWMDSQQWLPEAMWIGAKRVVVVLFWFCRSSLGAKLACLVRRWCCLVDEWLTLDALQSSGCTVVGHRVRRGQVVAVKRSTLVCYSRAVVTGALSCESAHVVEQWWCPDTNLVKQCDMTVQTGQAVWHGGGTSLNGQ